jgi:hypothetical protein
MQLSRRQFLQLFGITTTSNLVSMTGVQPTFDQVTGKSGTVHGRILQPTVIYEQPSLDAASQQSIWADTIVELRAHRDGWYSAGEGYVPVTVVQPIMPSEPITALPSLPIDAVVSAPSTSIRAYAHHKAEVVTRVGNGGVLQAVDCIHYPQTGDWYQVAAADGRQLGWTQAAHWRPLPDADLTPLQVHIDRQSYTLTLDESYSTQVNLPEDLPSGRFWLTRSQIGGHAVVYDGRQLEGVPNVMKLESGHRLHGVYWHNRFGQHADSIETNIMAARWLWAADELFISIT